MYFANTALDAAKHSQHLVRFIVEKSRLLDRLRGQINKRQETVLLRMFAEGIDGFKGGLSASNYMTITGAPPTTTTTNDLSKLVMLGALTKTGERKGSRYWLNIDEGFVTTQITP